MKFFTVFGLICLWSFTGYTQKRTMVFHGTNMQQMVSTAYYIVEDDDNEFNIFHYLYPAWHPGRIEFVDGTSKDSIYLNYNLVKGTLEEYVNGKLQVYSMYRVKRFEIIDYDLKKYATYLGVNALVGKSANKLEFVRLVADGDAKLVERAYFKMPPAGSGPSSYGGMYDGTPDKKREYYLYEHNVLKPLRKAATFAGQKKQIRDFVKAQGLRWNNESDLIRIVTQYNSLKDLETSSLVAN